jgi:hypothetical protein
MGQPVRARVDYSKSSGLEFQSLGKLAKFVEHEQS